MTTAHFHFAGNPRPIIAEYDKGIQGTAAEIHHAFDDGGLISVPGFGGIDVVLVNPDRIERVYLVDDN